MIGKIQTAVTAPLRLFGSVAFVCRGRTSVKTIAVGVAGSLFACLTGAASAEPKTVQEKLRPLIARWEQARQDLHVAGMAVAVVRGDQVVLIEPFGVRNVESGKPVTRDTVFYIASSTKSFTAMAVCMLADQDKVDLDAPVKRYLPRFELAEPAYTSSTTLRDLLSHRMGLRSVPITFGEAFSGDMNEDRYYRLLSRTHPRGRFGYSNLHYTLAGRVIESVTGLTWKQFVTKNIFAPVGMNRSYCSADEMYRLKDVALPTIEVGGDWIVSPVRKTDATMHAAGGMGCSITDLAKWVQLNLNGGEIDGRRILSRQRIDEMQSQQAEAGTEFYEFKRAAYGLGWYVGSYQGETLIHHFGGFEGARAHVSFMPQHDIGVAVVTNQEGYLPDLVACDVYDTLLGLTHRRDLLVTLKKRFKQRRMDTPTPEATDTLEVSDLSLTPDNYAGTYVSDDWGTLQVSISGTLVRAHIGNVNLDLASSSTDHFRTRLAPGASQTDGKFVVENAGRVSFIEMETPDGPARFARQ